MENPCIHLEDVSFNAGEAMLFQQLNLEIPSGLCTVFMGPTGCGKSTLLKIAAGLLVPTEGRTIFKGQDWDELHEHDAADLRAQTGFVFQNGALWANKTIYQNIELPILFHWPKLSASEVRQKIEELCEKLGYKSDLNQRPSHISLGEQKMVSFLRALILDPDVLFLDDPTASLDSLTRERILFFLDELRKKGRTILLVTQDPTVTARLADHLVIMKSGKILAQGSFQEVTRNSDPDVVAILTSVLSQAATFSSDILDLLSGGENLN